jgi:hypothetical protein
VCVCVCVDFQFAYMDATVGQPTCAIIVFTNDLSLTLSKACVSMNTDDSTIYMSAASVK